LQAITLAKALNDRNRGLGSTLIKNPSSVTSTSPTRKALTDQNKLLKPNFDQVDHVLEKKGADLNESSPKNKGVLQSKFMKSDFGSIKQGILKKIKVTKDILNFENDYFFGLIKRNQELAGKYMKDKTCIMKFDRKVEVYETIGEVSMSLTQVRLTSVLAYTDVHIFYLDQKSYEKVFYAQLEEIQEKLNFFKDYFRDISFDTLKKMCFLFTEKKFKLGEIIYREEEGSDNLYFIKSGEVQVCTLLKSLINLS